MKKPLYKRRDFEVTERTLKNYAFLKAKPDSSVEHNSSYYGRLLAWEITGKQTEHLQENIQLIRDFLNDKWQLTEEKALIGHTCKLGEIRIWTPYEKIMFDLSPIRKGKKNPVFLFRNGFDKNLVLDKLKEITQN